MWLYKVLPGEFPSQIPESIFVLICDFWRFDWFNFDLKSPCFEFLRGSLPDNIGIELRNNNKTRFEWTMPRTFWISLSFIEKFSAIIFQFRNSVSSWFHLILSFSRFVFVRVCNWKRNEFKQKGQWKKWFTTFLTCLGGESRSNSPSLKTIFLRFIFAFGFWAHLLSSESAFRPDGLQGAKRINTSWILIITPWVMKVILTITAESRDSSIWLFLSLVCSSEIRAPEYMLIVRLDFDFSDLLSRSLFKEEKWLAFQLRWSRSLSTKSVSYFEISLTDLWIPLLRSRFSIDGRFNGMFCKIERQSRGISYIQKMMERDPSRVSQSDFSWERWLVGNSLFRFRLKHLFQTALHWVPFFSYINLIELWTIQSVLVVTQKYLLQQFFSYDCTRSKFIFRFSPKQPDMRFVFQILRRETQLSDSRFSRLWRSRKSTREPRKWWSWKFSMDTERPNTAESLDSDFVYLDPRRNVLMGVICFTLKVFFVLLNTSFWSENERQIRNSETVLSKSSLRDKIGGSERNTRRSKKRLGFLLRTLASVHFYVKDWKRQRRLKSWKVDLNLKLDHW